MLLTGLLPDYGMVMEPQRALRRGPGAMGWLGGDGVGISPLCHARPPITSDATAYRLFNRA
ncbi:hypothetical protein DVK44_12295 [Streptomyces paludis]|uniref:Uncharacterized protein n=1 Tax=Streptomyces paludis TaxID=2282738 RepID=A0A345HNT6_9ACTN|nr:hypothetical protein DVK44_12295 [Streptomyces paludis]